MDQALLGSNAHQLLKFLPYMMQRKNIDFSIYLLNACNMDAAMEGLLTRDSWEASSVL
jgi:hypothetical protein